MKALEREKVVSIYMDRLTHPLKPDISIAKDHQVRYQTVRALMADAGFEIVRSVAPGKEGTRCRERSWGAKSALEKRVDKCGIAVVDTPYGKATVTKSGDQYVCSIGRYTSPSLYSAIDALETVKEWYLEDAQLAQ